VRLGAEVVYFVRLHLFDDVDEAGGVGQVAVMQDEIRLCLVGVLVEVIDAGGVEQGGAPLDAMDLVPLLQQ
jgi:hypothetical protein